MQTIKATNSAKLQEEYEKLVQGLKRVEDARADENAWANPGRGFISFCKLYLVLPDAILKESVPGTIRTAEHFIIFMRRLMEYIKHRMRTKFVQIESPAAFLRDIKSRVYIERKPLR